MIEEQKDDSGSVSLPFGKQTVVGSTVILGDCVEVMKGFVDNQFDLAIVDPPYGIGLAGYNTSPKTIFGKKVACKGSDFVKKEWDILPTTEYWEQLFRVSKNQIVWGGNYFTDFLKASKGWVYWKKNTNGLFADGELAWTSFNIPLKEYEFTWNGLLQENMKEKEKRIHPTQKPKQLYKFLLQNYAKAGDLILDTHLGSGSSRIACYELGFDFTGIEIDKEYFDLSEKRFKQYKSQLRIEGW